MLTKHLLILVSLVSACTPSIPSQSVVALTDVTIIDGTGAAPRPHMTVLIEGGRIAAIYPVGSRPTPAGAHAPEVGGSYVIPGLIDSHVHLASFERPDNIMPAILRHALLGGVTAVRDMGGNVTRVLALARDAGPAGAASPRIYGSAVFAGPRWFAEYDAARVAYWSGADRPGTAPGVRQIDDTTNITAAVAAAAALGVRGIKLYSDLSPARVAEIGVAARAAGLALWSHAVVPPSRPDEIVAAAPTSISHSDQVIWSAVPSGGALGDRAERSRLIATVAADAPPLQELYGAMKRRGTLLEPTLIVMQLGSVVDGRFGPLGEVQAWAVAAARAAHAAGVRIVAGTDAIGLRIPQIHTEMQLLVRQVGLTPLQAIQAATEHGAMALGIADSVGTVTVGKWADLVVLRADPSRDIRNTQTVRMVLRGGVVHLRTTAWEVAPGAEPPPEG